MINNNQLFKVRDGTAYRKVALERIRYLIYRLNAGIFSQLVKQVSYDFSCSTVLYSKVYVDFSCSRVQYMFFE